MVVRRWARALLPAALLAGCGRSAAPAAGLPANSAAQAGEPGPSGLRAGAPIAGARLVGPYPDLAAYCQALSSLDPDSDPEDCLAPDEEPEPGCGVAQRWSSGGSELIVTIASREMGHGSRLAMRNRAGWFFHEMPFLCTDRVSSTVYPLEARRLPDGRWLLLLRSMRTASWNDGEDAGGVAAMEGLFVCAVPTEGTPSCTRELPLAWGEVDDPVDETDTPAPPPSPRWYWRLAVEVVEELTLRTTLAAGHDVPGDTPFLRGRLCGTYDRAAIEGSRCESPRNLIGLRRLALP